MKDRQSNRGFIFFSSLAMALPQEPVVNVGAVYGHMAAGATLIMRIDHAVRSMVRVGDAAARFHAEIARTGVALQAKLGDRGSG